MSMSAIDYRIGRRSVFGYRIGRRLSVSVIGYRISRRSVIGYRVGRRLSMSVIGYRIGRRLSMSVIESDNCRGSSVGVRRVRYTVNALCSSLHPRNKHMLQKMSQ
jgi:hypothetical protein